MEQKQYSEVKTSSEGGALAGSSVLCYSAAVEVLRFGLGSQMSRKIHFPSLQTVVSVSVMEGLRIDLNYLGCLEKLSEEEADLKSCNKQHSSFHDNLLFSACLPAASTINTISASLSVSKVWTRERIFWGMFPDLDQSILNFLSIHQTPICSLSFLSSDPLTSFKPTALCLCWLSPLVPFSFSFCTFLINHQLLPGSTAGPWLALFPHSKKVLGSKSRLGPFWVLQLPSSPKTYLRLG